MPVILLVVSTLVFWVIFWFIRMGGVDHFRDLSARRKDDAQRAAARESERIAPLRAIDDPRDAATVLMLLIPRGGDPTRAQFAAVQEKVRAVFGFDQDLAERVTHARFIAGRAKNFVEAAGLFSELFNKRLTADERRELVDMVEGIARIDGPSDGQAAAIEVLKRRIGLAPAA
jgi:hypothetical protein